MVSQISSELLLTLTPQFNVDGAGTMYPRLVGILFLTLGLARFYGAMYINEKGALIVSMWSWIVELFYIVIEIFRSHFFIFENVMTFILAPLMLIWTLIYYKKSF